MSRNLPKVVIAIDPGTLSWGYAIFWYNPELDRYELHSFGELKVKKPKGVQNHFINRLPMLIDGIMKLFWGFYSKGDVVCVIEEPKPMWKGRSIKTTGATWCAFGVFYAVMYGVKGYPVISIPAKGYSKHGSDDLAAVEIGKAYISKYLEKEAKYD